MDIESKVGVFFVEQAALISDVYNPILVVFKPKTISRNNFNFFNFFKIDKKTTASNLSVLEITYPSREFLGSKINDYFKALTIRKLRNFLTKANISISFIHAQSIFDAGIWAYLYNSKFKTPYIITEHNQLSFINVTVKKGILVKKCLENSVYNLVVSNDKIRQFIANNLYFDFINIGNLINNKFYCLENTAKNTVSRLVTIGAFCPIKDHNTIFKALEIVDKQLSEKIEFIWIGQNSWGNNQDKEVEKFLKNFQYKNITLILEPILDREEIANYLQNSNLFIFSSLSEGMPVSVLEALACGLPVFSSNCGGVDEIINQDNGRIYQIKDYQKLSNLILNFFNNEYEFDKNLISSRIIDKFGETAFRNKLLSIYDSIN